MSGEFTEHADVRFTVKELLVELRHDLRSIDTKLELKADSERLAKLERQLELSEEKLERRLDLLEAGRNKILGGLAVVGLGTPVVTGIVVYLLTKGL